jgi:UDP-N-acetylmuramate: L-alanyl-gamma-D-glutamyl-meso-diaminopimelate ligase
MTAGNMMALPKDIQKIHLIAICGTGMGALACMLKESGYVVSGSDQHVYPPISEFLKSHEIPIQIGFQPENLRFQPDLVVVGNAVSKDNPEVRAMQEMGLPFCSMPQAVNRFAAAGKRQLVVAGTHGKTTTSSFLAWLLTTADLDPSFLIGGIVSNFNSNYRVGQGKFIVLEGDEYDTAFFDKGPKFLHYSPEIAVLTSVEFDHADIFRDLDHVKSAFSAMLANLNSQSVLFAFDGDSNIDDIVGRSAIQASFYGHDPASSWYLGKITTGSQDTRFEVCHEGGFWAEFHTTMIGEHNLRNLLAGIAVGHRLGLDRDVISRALSTFRGVRRRQEIRGVKNGITVIDDFAHHPTAVRETVRAVKTFYHDRRLIAVFEPRTNSSRRKVFQSVYAAAFDDADMICIRQAPMLEKIPTEQRFSSEKLVRDLCRSGKNAIYFGDTDQIIDFLLEQARPRDVVLIMSNGGFDNIHARLLDRL